MKLLITLLAIMTMAVSAGAETSQILRQDINPAHLDPASFRGGVIEMNDSQIKLALFVQPSDASETKEVIVSASIYNATMNDCDEAIYEAKTLNGASIIITDRSEQSCDDVILFPVIAEFVTFEDGNSFTSVFEGSNFISLINPTGSLKLGTTLNLNYGTPAIMRAVNKVGTTVPQDTDGHDNPVVLPILYNM